jgi:dihydrofolate synthase/folylpolyglutamate synthase
MAAGVEQTFLPGRFQEFAVAGKTVIFDVAHNPQAAGVLANTLRTRFAGRPVTVVIGAMKDKDIRGILSALRPVADRFFFTQPAIDRACPAADLPMFLPDGPRPSFDTITGVGGAIGAALRVAAGPICVCGSFYTVAEAMAALHIAPFGGGTLAPTDGI